VWYQVPVTGALARATVMLPPEMLANAANASVVSLNCRKNELKAGPSWLMKVSLCTRGASSLTHAATE
jgi:hypothetical protein